MLHSGENPQQVNATDDVWVKDSASLCENPQQINATDDVWVKDNASLCLISTHVPLGIELVPDKLLKEVWCGLA